MAALQARAAPAEDTPPLGERIARLRRDRGMTLAHLAEACGLSEATLSRIENGKTAMSAHHLLRAAQHLGVDIASLFRDSASPVHPGMRAITPAGSGEREDMARFSTEILSAALSAKSMHPAINTITARSLDAVGGLTAHAGEEFLYVLEGRIMLHSELYQPTPLLAGDSLYFDGSMPHAYVNAGRRPARILVVVGPHGRAP